MSAKIFDVTLDPEEQELFDSLERGEWRSVDNLEEEKAKAKAKVAAANYLRKDARINIRLSCVDLEQLKQKAAYKGLAYQTFITSILHEYAAGHFA